jgi:hypothetical protein
MYVFTRISLSPVLRQEGTECEMKMRALTKFCWMKFRSANLLFVVKSSLRVRARSHIPRRPRSSDWLLPNVSNTSVTASRSSAAMLSEQRMLL